MWNFVYLYCSHWSVRSGCLCHKYFCLLLAWCSSVYYVILASICDIMLRRFGFCMSRKSTYREKLLITSVTSIYFINPFFPNTPFLYPRKTSENLEVFIRKVTTVYLAKLQFLQQVPSQSKILWKCIIEIHSLVQYRSFCITD